MLVGSDCFETAGSMFVYVCVYTYIKMSANIGIDTLQPNHLLHVCFQFNLRMTTDEIIIIFFTFPPSVRQSGKIYNIIFHLQHTISHFNSDQRFDDNKSRLNNIQCVQKMQTCQLPSDNHDVSVYRIQAVPKFISGTRPM